MGLTGKILVSLLLLFINIQTFAESQMVMDFSDIKNLSTENMLQADGSILFDGKKNYLKMANPTTEDSMAVYMKLKLTSSDFFNRTFELLNTADGEVESGSGMWGLSINYTKNGLWIVSKDSKYAEVINSGANFKFIIDEIYELYLYLDSEMIRIYVDGKCIAQKRLPYGYYYEAKNLYIGAGVLANSYSGMQLYDFKLFTGKQTKEESEILSFDGNLVTENKAIIDMSDLQFFNRGKLELKQDVRIKSGKCITLINPMKKTNSFGAYFDFTFNAKTQILKNTLEFFNTTDSMPEIMGKWGLSLNYDKNGLSLLTKSNVGTVIIKTGVFFRENERYSMFVYIDNCDVYIYVNGKCVKHSVNTNAFYKDATYLHVGAGVLVNSYVPMTLHDFKLINKTLENKKEVDEMLPSLMTSEDEKLNATVIAKDNKKEDFSFRIKNKENYFLAGAIASYAVSAVAFTFIPVSFGIYGYNNFIYQENLLRHNNAVYQSELDLYYKEMQRSSFNANAALTAGIILIPVCAATLTSGIILTVIYQKLKIEHLPKVAFGYTPNQACIVQFSISL